MTTNRPALALVVNPAAGSGAAAKMLPAVEKRLRQAIGNVRVESSRTVGDVERIAASCVKQGVTTVLSLGGDGTHSEVVNGILSMSPAPGAITVGALHAGTGGDFRRVLSTDGDLERTLLAIRNHDISPLDVGQVEFVDPEGNPASRWFVNVASCGVSGEIVARVNQSTSKLRGTLPFLSAAARALTRYRPARVRLIVDGRDHDVFDITAVVVCNGRWAGGGMTFAPDARVGDGMLDVILIKHTPLLTTLAQLPRLYGGTLVQLPQVRVFRGAVIEVRTLTDAPAAMDVDGESPGRAPATFRVVPGALRLLGARPELV